MLGSRSGALLGLVVALFIFEDQLRLTWLHKLAVLCCGWLIMGGWETLYIVIRTLPRDLTAVYKMVQLVGGTKWAEYRNLTVPKIFSATVARCPNKVLFYFGEEEWTFQQVEDYSNRVGHFFLQEGYGKGDTVAVFMENRPEFVCTWLGLAKIGVVPALINYNLRAESLHHSISVAGCKALVYSKHLEQFVSEVFSLLINGTRVSYPTFVTGREGGEKGGRSSGEKVPGSRDLDQLCLSQPSQPVPRSVQESINFTDKLLYIYTSGTTGINMPLSSLTSAYYLVRTAEGRGDQTRSVHPGQQRSDCNYRGEEGGRPVLSPPSLPFSGWDDQSLGLHQLRHLHGHQRQVLRFAVLV